MATKELVLEKIGVETTTEDGLKIVLHNDPVNTFTWVTECLVDICEHTSDQAEQCAWIVHTKGRYGVKSGSFDDLQPRCEALGERGLTVTIE